MRTIIISFLTLFIAISGKAMDLTIHVNEAGSLINQIDLSKVEEIESLTISGDLNGTDILVIRKMRNLKMLDMANACIVNGGNSYYQEFVASDNEIGDYFFYGSINPTNIVLPNNVTRIGQCAFKGLTNLEEIIIPNSVDYILPRAFEDCSFNLLTIEDGTNTLELKDAFEYCDIYSFYMGRNIHVLGGFSPILSNLSLLESLTISDNVTKIESKAFIECSGLRELYIPNSVISIGNESFCRCTSLKNITLSDNLLVIDDLAFNECSELTSITLPESITSIGKEVFRGCCKLTNANLPVKLTYISDGLFRECGCLSNIEFPESVISLGNYAFNGCSSLSSVSIPSNINTIGKYAFGECISLSQIVFEDSENELDFVFDNVTQSYGTAFHNCPIESIYLGRNLKWSSVTRNLKSLHSLTFGDRLIYINTAFEGCTGLLNISIPNSVKYIRKSAFEGCTGLTNLKFSNVLEIIEARAFYGCINLNNIVIPESVNTIGDYVFGDCNGLTSLSIGKNVTKIGNGAFIGCNNLIIVKSLNTIPPAITESTFDDVTCQNATLEVPIGCKTIYWLHPYWEKFYNIEERDFSTSVPEIILEEQPINRIYDMNGILRRDGNSNSLPNGIYIINGKKTLINR